jgi:hypothetical protein
MATVDSEEKRLSIAEIITHGVHNVLMADVPEYKTADEEGKRKLEAKYMGIALAFGQHENAEPFQYGNTVFIAVYDRNNASAYVVAYNADTPENYMGNIITFAQNMNSKRGVSYLVMTADKQIGKIINRILKIPIARGWNLDTRVVDEKENIYSYTLYIGG